MRNDSERIVQIYCGEGKGKTTAAVGQALRAAGHGFEILIIQFLKSHSIHGGEFEAIKSVPHIEMNSCGSGHFLTESNITNDDYKRVADAINYANEQLHAHAIDMLVFDEIGAVLELGLLDVELLLSLISESKSYLDIVLTGRYFPEVIRERADLITEMVCIKHPYNVSTSARCGIEY